VTPASSTTRHLGIDLGASSIKWTVVEREAGARGTGEQAGEHDAAEWRAVDRGQVPTRTTAGPPAIVQQLAEVGAEVLARWPDIASIGVTVPGAYDPATGEARFIVNLPGDWNGVAVTGPIRDALGVPTAMINDARAFGLAELRLGAGRGASSLVGIVLGTGVGGVIAVDGKVVMGHDGSAGEVGHHTIDPDGPPCNCGNRGCLEAFIRADRLAEACGAPTAEAAFERARAGDTAALAGLATTGRYLGIGVANLITLLAPDRVVIGGGVAAAGELLLAPAREETQRRTRMTSLADVAIVTAELGLWAGAIGAAVHGAEQAAANEAQPGGGAVVVEVAAR
jgi:glucokinase